MEIKDIEQEIIDEFSLFTDWMEKYEYLIDLGKNLPLPEEADKTEENLIEGCQSRVWLTCSMVDGRLNFKADSDAIITKGIISLLVRVFNNQKPEDVLASDFSFIEKIGLKENLSPTRANGLVSMIEKIRNYASTYCS